MIIIMNGPSGVGKSTVSNLLTKYMDHPIYIKGDDVLNMIVNAEIIDEHINLTEINVVNLVKNFTASGYKNIIYDFVYEEKACLDAFVAKLKSYVPDVFVIRLYCDLEENIRRDAKRNPEDICGKERVTELYEVFDKVGEALGHAINNMEISPEQTVKLILDYINNIENVY